MRWQAQRDTAFHARCTHPKGGVALRFPPHSKVMTSERWEKIAQIFHEVADRPPHERTQLLDETCAGDEELRREVEELLVLDATEDGEIDDITPGLAAGVITEGQRHERVGRVLGRYRILSALGAGGMGEVYLAEDTTLERKVALKLLPRAFTQNPDRVRRFAKEARAASGLNHPNILTIHEIGEWEGESFIAMEYVEGETLRERSRRSPLTIAEVLESAVRPPARSQRGARRRHRASRHQAGQHHAPPRRLHQSARLRPGQAHQRDARIRLTVTEPGRVMGTIHYMSPEQAMGQPLDHRSDIFSLGVVLHELATGQRLFEGKSEAAVYHAILNQPIPPIADAPPRFEQVLRRALERDPAQRYQSAADFQADLRRLAQGNSATEAARVAGRARRVRYLRIAAAAAAFVLAGYALWRQFPRAAANAHSPTPVNFVRLTEGRGPEQFPSMAPDGKTFVYASAVSGNWDIYLQRVGGSNAINLTKDSAADDTQPAFSPDGEYIAFRSERDGGGIFVTGSTGENTRRLTDFGYNPAWSPDGKEIAFATEGVASPRVRFTSVSQLWSVNVATGVKRLIPSKDAVQPSWSPHGQRIAYWGIPTGKRDIWTVAAAGGEPVQVTRDEATAGPSKLQAHDWNPVWSPDGRFLYYVSDHGGSMNLWRVAIDESTGKVLSQPEPVTIPATNVGHLSFSQDGSRMLYVQFDNKNNLRQIGFDPVAGKANGEAVHVTEGSLQTTDPAISPDGERLAFCSSGESQEDIFVSRSDGTDRRQLTNDVFKDRLPRWSPDGRRLAFQSNRSGSWEIWLIDADGSGLRQLTFTSDYARFRDLVPRWFASGLFSPGRERSNPPARPAMDRTSCKSKPPDETREWFEAWSWSPDGQSLAGRQQSVRHSGGISVYSIDSQKLEKLSETGYFPVWLNDSSRLLFYNLGKLYLIDRQSKKISEILSAAPYEIDRFDLSRDNRTICYSLTTKESDIWMMTLK